MSEKKSLKPTKEDIAKQFDLPERQSKITTLLNQAGQAYCICRSSDSSRFMIGCDACEEWYHGDCINISEKEARYIKTYFCTRCREEDPTLKTRFKPQKREHDERRDETSGREDHKKKRKEHSDSKSSRRSQASQPISSSKESKNCGDCSGCLRTHDCGRCEPCMDMAKYSSNSKLKIKCQQRMCVKNLPKRQYKQSSSRNKRHTNGLLSGGTGPGGGGESEVCLAHLCTSTPRQCHGPQCAAIARYSSKYCSDECGMKLATARIYQVLPQRIQEWSLSPCVAEEQNRKALDKVRRALVRAQASLRALDARHKELDVIVARAKHATIDITQDDRELDDEMSTYCITCGHEIHSRTASRHMEKCFVKHEAQASFGSRHRTRIDATSMFCDYYNAVNGTYCKRLRVLCPEHSKDPKISDTDVCGCPLVKDVFSPTGDFCRAPKKSCLKHHVWEKLRRAEIDMERVRQWIKVDELMEQERSIRLAMASRAGVLGLMLHSTYNHEVMERITGVTSAEAAKQEHNMATTSDTQTTTS